jgi:hypothetical protein
VPAANPPPDPSTAEDGRLDELAARHGVTMRQFRRMVGSQQSERPSAATAVDTDEVVLPSQAGGRPMTAAEQPSALDDGRIEELAASLSSPMTEVVPAHGAVVTTRSHARVLCGTTPECCVELVQLAHERGPGAAPGGRSCPAPTAPADGVT